MKKVYILMFILILTKGAIAQWIEQNSGTTNNLRAVHFIDTFNGFAVGDSGTILKTADGGTNWISEISGTNEQLNAVFCVNENCCFVAGSASISWSDTISTILKSTDGGSTWYNSSIGAVATNHQSIYFINQDTGYSVGCWSWWGGGSSTHFKTTDGGLTWSDVPSLGGGWGSKVAFLDADTGYILTGTHDGFDMYHSDIYKTTDGGATWNGFRVIVGSWEFILINDVCFVNSLIGYAIDAQGGNVLKTIDGGTTWVYLTSGTNMNYSIFFSDINTGYIAGWGIQKTTDGGITWADQNVYASSVYFPVPDTGYAVGDNGIILKTTNGGGLPVGLDEAGIIQGSELKVQSYPNPFSVFTTLEYELEHSSTVNLSIYNYHGQQVAVPVNGEQAAGRQQVRWEAVGLPAGVYYYQLRAEGLGQGSKGKLLKY